MQQSYLRLSFILALTVAVSFPLLAQKKTKRKGLTKEERVRIHTPIRISNVLTAFQLPKGQFLYRNSGVSTHELVFGGSFYHIVGGLQTDNIMLRTQLNLPINKYIHLGVSGEMNIDANFGSSSSNSTFDEPTFAYAPILTIGTPDRFINIMYKSKSPIILPDNDTQDASLFNRNAKYWSIGAGIKIGHNLYFMTESQLMREDNRQKHLRINAGLALHKGRHSIGFSLTYMDSEEVIEPDNFFFAQSGFPFVGSVLAPSISYMVRIN